MSLFRSLFAGGNKRSPQSKELSDKRMAQLKRDYLKTVNDEGATCNPSDYASTLKYLPPELSPEPPPGPQPFVLCGCCSSPLFLRPRETGVWIARGVGGRQSGGMVPICAVCIAWINDKGELGHFKLPQAYDAFGQDIANNLPLDDLQSLAIARILALRKMS